MRVFKYHLGQYPGRFAVTIPRGGKPVHVGEQDGNVLVWILVNPDHVRETIEFGIAATGQELTAGHQYFGTVQMANGLVWHVSHEKRRTHR